MLLCANASQIQTMLTQYIELEEYYIVQSIHRAIKEDVTRTISPASAQVSPMVRASWTWTHTNPHTTGTYSHTHPNTYTTHKHTYPHHIEAYASKLQYAIHIAAHVC